VPDLSVSVTNLQDTANALFGTDALNSICYTQTLTVADSTGAAPAYASVAANTDSTFTVTFSTTDW
jgi:hypothetical protein